MFILLCENPDARVSEPHPVPPSALGDQNAAPAALPPAGASSIPSGPLLLAISRQPPSSGADTCRVNCGRGRVSPGVEFCRCSVGLWVAGGSGHSQGPFSSDSASLVGSVMAGVGGPVHASCLPLVRRSRGLTLETPTSHILGSSLVGTVAGPSGHIHTTVCCRRRMPVGCLHGRLWLRLRGRWFGLRLRVRSLLLHGDVANGAPPPLSRTSFVNHSPS